MIDFDEIESQEKHSLELQKKADVVRREEEEERHRREEALRFKRDLALEQEVERRCQIGDDEKAEEQEGVLGIRLGGAANFTDSLNDSLYGLGRQFSKHQTEYASFQYLQRGTAGLVAFLNALVQCRFHLSVSFHFEQLRCSFAKPRTGLCAVLQEVLPVPVEVHGHDVWSKLGPCLHQTLARLKCILFWVTNKRKAVVDSLWLGHRLLSEYFLDLVGPIPDPHWPSVANASDVVEVLLRESCSAREMPVKVRSNCSVEELKRLLVECLYMSADIKLCTQTLTKLEALPPASKIRTIHRTVYVQGGTLPDLGSWKEAKTGDGEENPETCPETTTAANAEVNPEDCPEAETSGAEPLAEEALGDAAHSKTCEELTMARTRDCVMEHIDVLCRTITTDYLPMHWSSVAGSGWVTRWHILKTTPVTATRLLHELRTRFEAVEFQEVYKELKMRMRHIDCALKVQQAVLPAYGFADTIAGVNDMRNEVTTHEMHFQDKAVEKLRKEIHGLLEYGEPPRKVPVTRALDAPRIPLQQKSEWLRHLADEGFAVIANVVSEPEVARACELLWDFIETSDASGIVNRKLLQTWFDAPTRDRGWPAEKDDGIIHTRGIGQSDVLWYLRSLPALQSIFAEIWGTEDLVTSFDGAGVFRPYGQFEGWKTTKKNWFHVDQTHKRRGLHCVQGLLTMKPASRKTGGLVVVPQSHRFFGDILRRYDEPPGQDSLHLDMTDPVLTEGDGGPKLVCAEAGDFVIWDSRTVHCNTPPLVDDATMLNCSDLIRAVTYICMTPSAWCTKDVVERRHLATQTGITTTHVPHACRTMDVPERFPKLHLTPEQKKLVGRLPKLGEEPCEDSQLPGPGRISFLPERKLRVVRSCIPVRGSATFEWGSPMGNLLPGALVTGYRFGTWLRVVAWPEGSLPQVGEGLTEHQELWAPLKWQGGHMELVDGTWW